MYTVFIKKGIDKPQPIQYNLIIKGKRGNYNDFDLKRFYKNKNTFR